jgi:DNA-binding NarL/FixJ family response regulator
MTRILVVEDEPLVAEAISEALDDAGHQVVGIAQDAASALQRATEAVPDLVLMDIRLAGDGDGIDTALKIQADRPVPVVFISAHHDRQTCERAAAVQPALFLPKPFSPQQLLGAVTAAAAERSEV